MPDVSREVNEKDDNTSFLETALKVIKYGAYLTGGMWIASGVSKVALDVMYGGSIDTTFSEQAWNTLTPVFVGLVTTLLGWFIRDKAGPSE